VIIFFAQAARGVGPTVDLDVESLTILVIDARGESVRATL
jgi:hypothetical protein